MWKVSVHFPHSRPGPIFPSFRVGLYAAGNVMAGVMGADCPGAGATIASAMTFGWLAGRHAAR